MNEKNDCWLLLEQPEHAAKPVKRYKLSFAFFRSEQLKTEIQIYMRQQLRFEQKKPATLRQELCWLRYYEAWLYERRVASLAQITRADAEGFLSYLHICVSKKTGQPLCMLTQKHIYQTVCGIYRWYAFRSRAYVQPFLFFPTDVYARIGKASYEKSAEERLRAWLHAKMEEQRRSFFA